MRTPVKELKGLIELKAPVPPMLAKAIGYKGDARYVAFNWTPYGDEAEYFDGRVSATGNWQAFLAYIRGSAACLSRSSAGSTKEQPLKLSRCLSL